MNSESDRSRVPSGGRDRERTCRAQQNELWIICQTCAWPKAMGAVGTPDDVPYGLFGTRRRRCDYCGGLISWTAEFCDTRSAWLRISRFHPLAGR
jgi:hypothetical protein